MIGVITTILLAAQPQANTPQGAPLRSDDPPSRELSAAHDLFYQDENRRLTPDARAAMHRFGSCVVSNSRDLASRTIRSDFTSQRYRSALRQVSQNNSGCFRQSGRLSATGLMFAGALAEALLRQGTTPINVRLARAADAPATMAFSQSDRVSLCTVRSVPDQAAALFASSPGSEAEQAAIVALAPAVRLCSQGGPEVRATPAGLRAMLATAAFRTVADLPESPAVVSLGN
jgi:hypothetical protein